jgi:predicted dienelactone hydrolase
MSLYRLKIILSCFAAIALIVGLVATGTAAQIGHRTLTFYDSARDDRIVPAEVYYPSDQNGDNVPVSAGQFPLLVFAHGYQQVFSNYHDLWEHLVPKGYIMVFPTTEGGLTIDIDEYAADLSFLLDTLLEKSSGNDLFLTGHLNGTSALMGHSTGGGACYLAQKSNPTAHTIITLAALGSLYWPIYGSSPIDAAKELTVPGLVMAGGEDCICPVKENQQAIYDNLTSGPRALITITKGDHCGFSDSSNCWIAEAAKCGFLGQGPTISEDLQMTLTLRYVLLWLNSIMKGDERSWTSFQESLKQDQQVTPTLQRSRMPQI